MMNINTNKKNLTGSAFPQRARRASEQQSFVLKMFQWKTTQSLFRSFQLLNKKSHQHSTAFYARNDRQTDLKIESTCMVQNTRHFNYFKAEKNKNVIHQAAGRRPRAVRKTSGTVFPNTDRHRLVNNIFIFFSATSNI